MANQKLIIASNRLPIHISFENEKIVCHRSVGGLATGLSSFLESLISASDKSTEYTWVGWPGIVDPNCDKANLSALLLKDYSAYPVYLTEQEVDSFYFGFCNRTIWPLFHYFPSFTKYQQEDWTSYGLINQKFCDAILEIYNPEDTIWIHDYHLLLLPKLLRDKVPDIKIGFFLHIPFPHFEVYRLLPMLWRKEIILGLLGSDLIGFHTYDYTQYFLRSVLRILGLDNNFGLIQNFDHFVKVETFPMGIQFDKFRSYAESEECEQKRRELSLGFKNIKLILSVDRLDYSKGIVKRLEAFEFFLNHHPIWKEKVVLIMILVPSRVEVPEYFKMRETIEGMIGKINGLFGTLDWTPIVYQYRSYSFEELVALYGISNVAMVTPLRDGMNLVAKEYLVSKPDNSGVLVLSEMAGAAKELTESILINPNNAEDLSAAILEALEMPLEEQITRNLPMVERIKRYDVNRWANDFLEKLDDTKNSIEDLSAKLLQGETKRELLIKYSVSKKRLLFLDYDGTLVAFAKDPNSAVPKSNVLGLLKILSSDSRNIVYIVSGRSRLWLDKTLSGLNLRFIAEHGVWKKEDEDWTLFRDLSAAWKTDIYSILDRYVDRLPGSFIEEKEFSLVWHFRGAESEAGENLSRELLNDLVNFTGNLDIQVLKGNKVVEVKSAGVNKGISTKLIASEIMPDFILAIGDDWTDEDMFRELSSDSFSIKVGIGPTSARFYLKSVDQTLDLLHKLADASKGE
ncbi:bifunctional alpha,alpha-trehalose-phosphate synthase (UDP-forming)/trehalose-phosphatase [Leptospira ainazelensis]|uniref:bifunctional alpha,alpha-trehalose-phosphate synthase (UDP-forming)/trehalose-phosphatase n=1 Tax=Leptospira ainazelensis TaxID=2810034 RepID=UPI001E427640|nr:bifunctional alpha,alpha-trehalose-phosphate synthase (UDP-forming)/trehalose-phosphatase [Leptospira ainazelensis]